MMLMNRLRFILFICLSIGAALTEGLGISMIAPILESANNATMFEGKMIFGQVAAFINQGSPVQNIRVAAVILLVVVVFRGVLQFGVQYVAATLPLHLQQQMANERFQALIAAQVGYVHGKSSGYLMQSIIRQPERVSILLKMAASIASHMFIVLIYLIMMFLVSWRLTLVTIVFLAGLSYFLRMLSAGPMKRSSRNLTEAQTTLGQIILESISGARLIHLAGADGHVKKRFSASYDHLIRSLRLKSLFQALPSPTMMAVGGVFLAMILLLASVMFESEPSVWIGEILIFMFILLRLMGPVVGINNARIIVLGEKHALEDSTAFLNEARASALPNGAREMAHLERDIRLKDLSFSYDADLEEPALVNIDMTIPKGKTIAVVGKSGAGKSTLVALIARLHDPTSGGIEIDGVDLRDFDVNSWRRHLGMVSQDIVIFNDTVRNNLCFGLDVMPDEDTIIAAAKKASAHDFIEGLPQGYDTMLGDRGVRLSGGQQQRLAIARVMLTDPDVLILDEATSHLDTLTEKAVQTAVDTLGHEKTIVIIAHRLSTIRNADQIVVMDAGCIVEQGTHDELMKLNGAYRQLHQSQMLTQESDEVAT